ncbi:MAG: tripartite tricarboxylate transporter substrate binding protein [Hyphomicrobiales bacterium]|nr:tripartite tricarboxylate transporter substrate binding protein [Hyphomicrobiales bacterium]
MSLRCLMTGLVMLLSGIGAASAQDAARDYPNRPIRIIVGFAAGGIADLGARLLGDHITRQTGAPVVVENRTAAAGTVAAHAVAKADPDGYTLGLVLSGQLVINPFVQKQMPFDALKDLVPVAAVGEAPQMIAINAEVPAKTLKEFVALAKAKPGTLMYGSAGHGSLPHLSAAEFVRQAGIEMVHVPYRGNQPATSDLLVGRIHLLSSSIGGLRPGLDAGKIRLLLVATRNRLPYIADVPTSAQAGLPDYLMTVWLGLVAPVGTPPPIVERAHGFVQDMLKDETMVKRMAGAAIDTMPMSRDAFRNFVADEYARWQTIVKAAGVEPQ